LEEDAERFLGDGAIKVLLIAFWWKLRGLDEEE